ALLGVLPAQDLLAHKRHHYGVIHVVVGRIAIGNILQSKTSHESNDVRISRLEDAIALQICRSKLLDKRLNDDMCGIKHGRLPNGRRYSSSSPPSRERAFFNSITRNRIDALIVVDAAHQP